MMLDFGDLFEKISYAKTMNRRLCRAFADTKNPLPDTVRNYIEEQNNFQFRNNFSGSKLADLMMTVMAKTGVNFSASQFRSVFEQMVLDNVDELSEMFVNTWAIMKLSASDETVERWQVENKQVHDKIEAFRKKQIKINHSFRASEDLLKSKAPEKYNAIIAEMRDVYEEISSDFLKDYFDMKFCDQTPDVTINILSAYLKAGRKFFPNERAPITNIFRNLDNRNWKELSKDSPYELVEMVVMKFHSIVQRDFAYNGVLDNTVSLEFVETLLGIIRGQDA